MIKESELGRAHRLLGKAICEIDELKWDLAVREVEAKERYNEGVELKALVKKLQRKVKKGRK